MDDDLIKNAKFKQLGWVLHMWYALHRGPVSYAAGPGGATLKHAGGGICVDWRWLQAVQTWRGVRFVSFP